MSAFLTVVLVAAVTGYGVFVLIHLIRQRKSGGCSCGCGSCPYAASCRSTEKGDEENDVNA